MIGVVMNKLCLQRIGSKFEMITVITTNYEAVKADFVRFV
jgi:hypothetical protein